MRWSTTETVTGQRDEADWLRGGAEEGQAQQYLEALRRSAWLIALVVLLSTGAALLYLARVEPVYEAGADVLVSPTFDRGTDVVGLSVLGTSGDPTRTVETAARLMTTTEVASRVRDTLRLDRSEESLRRDVDAVPVASSDVVTVTARASEPEAARRLADAFVQAAIAERTQELHGQLDELIPRVQARLDRTRDPEVRAALSARLADFETLRQVPDRGLRPATRAELPDSPVSPRSRLTLVVAVIAGLLVGIGGVIALELLSPRVWREAQLRARYRLPVLARLHVPRLPAARRLLNAPRAVPAASGALRGLRAALMAREDDGIGGRCVVVTSAAGDEGKSVVAFNLARSLTQAGTRVLLVEADPRRRLVDRRSGMQAGHGLLGVMSGEVPLGDAVVEAGGESEPLTILPMEADGEGLPDVISEYAAHSLLTQAEALADWVVIDAPPGDRLLDALPLALVARHVVLVVGLGVTRTAQLHLTAEALAAYHVTPAGFVLLGARGEGPAH